MNNCLKIYIVLVLSVFTGQLFAYDTVAVKELSHGVQYYHIISGEPLSMHLIEADITNTGIKLELGIANDGINMGGERTSNLAKRRIAEGINVIAAVNCDFFGGPGDWQAENSMIKKGEYIKGAKLDRTMMAITDNNIPYIGDFQFYGYVLAAQDTIFLDGLNMYSEKGKTILYNDYWNIPVKVNKKFIYYSLMATDLIKINSKIEFAWNQIASEDSTYNLREDEWLLQIPADIFSDHKTSIASTDFIDVYIGTETRPESIYTLFGGLPGLVKDGHRPESYLGVERLTSKGFIAKNPRTAIGYSKDKSKLFLLVVDGRQPELSAGMSLYELADFMISIGCYDLLNLDGGGSSTMTILDSVVNSPSDKTGERAVFNMLFITESR